MVLKNHCADKIKAYFKEWVVIPSTENRRIQAGEVSDLSVDSVSLMLLTI